MLDTLADIYCGDSYQSMTGFLAIDLAEPYFYLRGGIYYLRIRPKGVALNSFTVSLRTSSRGAAERISVNVLHDFYELQCAEPLATWEQLRSHLHGIAMNCLLDAHEDAGHKVRAVIGKKSRELISTHQRPGGKMCYITPRGVVTSDCAIHKPDFGNPEIGFVKSRGEYRVNLVVPLRDARAIMAKIVEVHKENYRNLIGDFKMRRVVTSSGRRSLRPYEGDMPFFENGDGTVTFIIKTFASYVDINTGVSKEQPLEVVDSRGVPIPNVPAIGGGSELKVKFSMFPYGWSIVSGASIKLKLEGVMLIRLRELESFSGWENEAVGGGYTAWSSP